MNTDDAIRRRCTEKVLAGASLPTVDRRQEITEIVALAGMAPFHRACEEHHRKQGDSKSTMDGIEPWRFTMLDATACRRLVARLPSENAGKIPAMLAAADALVLATWLPNQSTSSDSAPSMGDEPGFELTLANVEHIAAASAAVQNMLLAATARGISNYWSSGGVLRLTNVLDMLGIPATQRLLGAIFFFPKQIADAELATSKLRAHRTSCEHWSRWIELDG